MKRCYNLFKETLINSSARWPALFVTDCVNASQRSYGYAFGPFPCQSQKALGHRTNSFNQRFLINVMFPGKDDVAAGDLLIAIMGELQIFRGGWLWKR